MNDITVILNGFKRAKHFDLQLASIRNQTIKPASILFWQNGNFSEFPKTSDELIKASCNQNLGVWARFAFALNAKTEWVCVFDDDTIPGPRWFENCLETMKSYEGLMGTVGVLLKSDLGMFPFKRYGWTDTNNRSTVEVDFVGHSWFFHRDWLSYFWRELPPKNHNMLVGEDIHFSLMLRKHGRINTYVPPHPSDDRSLWGSQSETGLAIGQDASALYLIPGSLQKMNDYLEYCKTIGFEAIRKRPNFIEV
jgi:GT2 family glycosyltransferase